MVGARFSEYIRQDESVDVEKVSERVYKITFKDSGVEIILGKSKLLELIMKFTHVLND